MTKEEREDMEWQATFRLVVAFMLHVYDEVYISGKWYYRKNISLGTLRKKKQALYDIGKWMKTSQWDTWCSVYTEYIDTNRQNIKSKFERIRKKSQRYVNQRIKDKENRKTSGEM